MMTFETACAQGDVYIRNMDANPAWKAEFATMMKDAVAAMPENGVVIVTHSETGHHHVMEATKVKMYNLPGSLVDCLLVVDQDTTLEHLREFDTHKPIMFKQGNYHVRRQREYTPEGFRVVQD